MSVFVFDTDTLDMIRYMLALEHFKKYLIGPQGLNEHICALSLERVLIQTGLKFPQFQKANPREIRLYDIVRFLQQKRLVSPTIANELSQYVDFHDSLIQKGSQTTAAEKANKAQEILRFLCTEAGIKQEKELKNRTFQEIANLAKKPPAANQTYEIIESDFDILEQLYEKSTILQHEIQRGLKTPLREAQISGFTPNTGGSGDSPW
jgi:hypothetical protein